MSTVMQGGVRHSAVTFAGPALLTDRAGANCVNCAQEAVAVLAGKLFLPEEMPGVATSLF